MLSVPDSTPDHARDASVLRDIESILERSSCSLTGSERLADIAWDSMAVVMFIAIMEGKHRARIPPKSIAAAHSVSDLCALVKAHATNAGR
jgi:acyl carrier protein